MRFANKRPAWLRTFDKLLDRFFAECEKNLHCPCGEPLIWQVYGLRELMDGAVISCASCGNTWLVQDCNVKVCLTQTVSYLLGAATPAHS